MVPLFKYILFDIIHGPITAVKVVQKQDTTNEKTGPYHTH